MNGSRSRPGTRLAEADIVRIPPVISDSSGEAVIGSDKLTLIANSIIYEDHRLIVINKPHGMAVHAGSGLRFGVIDILRRLRPDAQGLELAHRLDRDTSGCLVCAKDYPTLRAVQEQLGHAATAKTYSALLCGRLDRERFSITDRLSTTRLHGEKRTFVDEDGKNASTEVTVLSRTNNLSYARVRIGTGRTHQIRAHAAAIDHPIAGDKKYGDLEFNKVLAERGLRRMFLHAQSITLRLDDEGSQAVKIEAPLPADLARFLTVAGCEP